MRFLIFTWFFLMPLLRILLGIDVALVSGQCQKDQRSLLLQVHDSLKINASESTKLVSWSMSEDCCNWAGVSCDEVGHVTGLDLSNESISGGIENSSGLFSLSYLRMLNLSGNNFNTTLPTGLANLTELIHLNLSNAGFVNQIPIEIWKMKSLVTLDLSSLYFPGVVSLILENPNLATLVQNFKQLTELHLDGVNLSASSNEWCQALSSSLPNLQVLSLSNCYLAGPIHPSLAKLQSLSVIRLDSNDLNTPFPDFFANFSKLTVLRLSSCQLNGTVPVKVFQMPTLEILDLSNNKLLQGSLAGLGENMSLRTMVLSNTQLSGALPQSLGNLTNLSRIELAGCNFSGPIPSSIAMLTQLVRLDFSNNAFNGSFPSLQKSKKLNYVDCSRNGFTGEIPSSYWEGLSNLVNVDLRSNLFRGSIPSSLFTIPSLQKIQLSENQFEGGVPEIQNASFSSLNTLDLQSNKLEGPVPQSIFDIKGLSVLLLSSNKLNGTIKLDQIWKLRNLTALDLSYNNLTVDAKSGNSTTSSSPQFSTLKLASCNFRVFPDLGNQSRMLHLDLSDNQINGSVPHWIWKVGSGSLIHLNLSKNLLKNLEEPYSFPNLSVLDLHLNQLHGKIPPPPPSAAYIDYSSNKFNSDIPQEVDLSAALFFSASNNSLTGAVPKSICNATFLQVLDLSNNKLNGTIPECLIERSNTLRVLNLRRNNFSGSIPDSFQDSCGLKTLDLSGNRLVGKIPGSVANCTDLEVLDLGNNQLNDVFPCLLKSISSLRVIVLRNNTFSGKIGCKKTNTSWPGLQIVDLAFNKFNGILPHKCLSTWEAMKGNANDTHGHLNFKPFLLNQLYYQDSVTVTSKGLQMDLVKILTVFTSVDLSSNNFEGPIPEVIGQFKGLYVLNFSHNALNGSIPSSLGNLTQLESLDLSVNNLTGTIPQQLAGLTFLSFLNLSSNNLFGIIPTSTQLQSFLPTSFEDNAGLCGPPLLEHCQSNIPRLADPIYRKDEYNWQFILIGVGFGLGSGLVLALSVFCKSVNKWYNDRIDKILLMIFPMLGLAYYTRNDWRIVPEDDSEEDTTEFDEVEHDEEAELERRYCVFCSKLDITIKQAIHDPKCICYHSPPMSSLSSFSSPLLTS
ncbi:hypothetical protein K2173_008492 [Erythroxylum novogranatense]|uniref:Leucine-rich repeat-containing N-terminal plant-type domain-containing protein n=1 Tax=Erythroxylum novogranatense TaxID=1862640 RepID=A0AAV8U8Z6_9ROSI|nr:hypothetical protein K2173_008492 [Erythroxylum novogranatense]